MTYLFVFIAGMLFYSVIIPLLNILIEYIETKKELFVSNLNVSISKNNSKIQKLQMELENEKSSISAIGFECSPSNEYTDDECEDDKINIDRKVGFR